MQRQAASMDPSMMQQAMRMAQGMTPEQMRDAQAAAATLSPDEITRSTQAMGSRMAGQQQYEYNAALQLKNEGNKLHGAQEYRCACQPRRRPCSHAATLGSLNTCRPPPVLLLVAAAAAAAAARRPPSMSVR